MACLLTRCLRPIIVWADGLHQVARCANVRHHLLLVRLGRALMEALRRWAYLRQARTTDLPPLLLPEAGPAAARPRLLRVSYSSLPSGRRRHLSPRLR